MMNAAATPMAVAPTAITGAELFELPRAVCVPPKNADGRRAARPPEPPRLRSSTADVLVGDGGLVMTSCVVAGLASAAIAKIVARVTKRTMMAGVGFDRCNLLRRYQYRYDRRTASHIKFLPTRIAFIRYIASGKFGIADRRSLDTRRSRSFR
jgi:hypothetical protein